MTPPLVLLLCHHADDERHRRKFAGVQRFAGARGWEVRAFPPGSPGPGGVRSLLAELRPAGCIVEASGRDPALSPRLFGTTPVVWLDPPAPPRSGRAAASLCDNAAVGRAAFRELSALRPSCFAAVPSPSMLPWNRVRVESFRERCAASGRQVFLFDGKRDENLPARISRLAAWLGTLPPDCAVFAANDLTAAHVAVAARAAGRSIPSDMALLGVDGSQGPAAAAFAASDVSTIQLDFDLAGHLAAKALASLMDGATAGDKEGGMPALPGDAPRFGPLLVLRRESTRGRDRGGASMMLDAVETIRREAALGLTAAALAARFPWSRKRFERLFHEATGHSVLDEILHVRLEAVMARLSRPDLAIGPVASMCGFGTERELQKLFRARFGTSMRAWRAMHAR